MRWLEEAQTGFVRFWAKVEVKRNEECWPWLAYTGHNGYGQFFLETGWPWGAHRVAYLLVVGDPKGMCVCHSCDNKICCNPSHLWIGTYADNNKDMTIKNRHGNNSLAISGAANGNWKGGIATGNNKREYYRRKNREWWARNRGKEGLLNAITK